VKDCWTERPAREHTVNIAAGTLQVSAVANWMLLEPAQAIEPVLSATAIDAYDACPLKFKLMREWKIPGPASAAMIYGNVMHTVLKDLHDAERDGRRREEGQVLGLFGELMDAAEFEDDLQQRLYREQGVRQLVEYVQLRYTRPNPTVLDAEKNFLVKIAGIRVKGRMDRVDQLESGTRVIDFKTGKAFTEQKANSSLQLGIYALAGRELWGAVPKELVIYNLEDNSEVSSRRTERALADLEKKVTDVAAGITAGDFHEAPGFHCRWCDFRNVCPAHEQQLYTVVRSATAS
jgi:RecB family exonuclease